MPSPLQQPSGSQTTNDILQQQQNSANLSRKTLITANTAAQTAINTAIDTAMSALPPPLNAGAKALTDGITKAFKVPLLPTDLTAPNADPVKLLAIMLAIGIILAIWCFIKAILHPLPIIGLFFPLCSDDPDATAADKSSSDNQALARATDKVTSATPKAIPVQLPPSQFAPTASLKNPMKGMTFDQYINKIGAATPATQETAPNLADIKPSTSTAANIDPQPTVKLPEWQSGEQQYNELKKLFGL